MNFSICCGEIGFSFPPSPSARIRIAMKVLHPTIFLLKHTLLRPKPAESAGGCVPVRRRTQDTATAIITIIITMMMIETKKKERLEQDAIFFHRLPFYSVRWRIERILARL